MAAAASPFMSLLLSAQVLLRFRGPQNISASSHQKPLQHSPQQLRTLGIYGLL